MMRLFFPPKQSKTAADKRHSAEYTGEKEVLKDCGEDGRHST